MTFTPSPSQPCHKGSWESQHYQSSALNVVGLIMLEYDVHPSLGICCIFNILQEEKVHPRESRLFINFMMYKEAQAVVSFFCRPAFYRWIISIKEFEKAQVQLGNFPITEGISLLIIR